MAQTKRTVYRMRPREHALEAARVVVEPRVGGDKSRDLRLVVGIESLYTAPGSQCDTVRLVRIGRRSDVFEAGARNLKLRERRCLFVPLSAHGGVRT